MQEIPVCVARGVKLAAVQASFLAWQETKEGGQLRVLTASQQQSFYPINPEEVS